MPCAVGLFASLAHRRPRCCSTPCPVQAPDAVEDDPAGAGFPRHRRPASARS
ncbi:hypothetical protein ACU4GD_35855 [Cupriavidus basilensis]